MKINNFDTNAYIQQPTKAVQKDSPPKKDTVKIVQPKKSSDEIPKMSADSTMTVPEGSHLVQPKETLYSIAMKYGTSISELIELNPNLRTDKNGNKIIEAGSILKVYPDKINETPHDKTLIYGSWQIESGKGLYSVMTKFNLFREELAKLNPNIDLDNIKREDVFKVPGYKVKEGDTLEKIAKSHDITVDMLLKLNPKFENSLKSGDVLNVPKLAGQDLGFEDLEVEFDVIEETPQKISHTVKNGEALSLIAEKYNVPMWAIMLHNNIENEDKIFKNQVLKIPTGDEIAELEKFKNKPQDKKVQEDKSKTYKIQTGDTLSEIAFKNGVSTASVMFKNNIKNPKHIRPGQIIIIPNKKEAEELEATQQKLKTEQKPTVQKKKISSSVSKNNILNSIINSNRGIVQHKVKKGETLLDISKKYKIPVKDLIMYNSNLKGIKSSAQLSEKEIKTIQIIGTKKAVIFATGVSEDFINELISIEKKRNKLYNDDCGIPTIGIGHNTRANNDTNTYRCITISDNQIYSLLARDITDAQNKIKNAIGKEAYNNLSPGQKEALYGLIFNTGGLQGSPKLTQALKDGDYVEAACQMNHACGTVNGKKQVLPGLAKRRFMDIAKFVEGSRLSRSETKTVMRTVQELYDSGFKNIRKQNTKVDYNAYAKKFLGEYIDKGWVEIIES